MADQQSLQADLGVEVLIVDGVPADMAFDVTGSRIVLDKVRVKGGKDQFEEEDWSGVLTLTRGDTVFTNPLELNLDATLEMSDSRPIVALFRNQEGWRPEFIANMMTTEDIAGTASMNMANNRIEIPEARVISDKMEAGMKAVIESENRNGVIYLRYKKLDALLKIKDGKKNLDLIKVKEK